MQFIIFFAIGTITGIITGFGIGGGTLLILFLTLFMNYDQVGAQGINLVYFLPCAALSLISHIRNGRVERKIAVPAGISGTVVAFVAAYLATRMPVKNLSRFFGAFLLLVAFSEIYSLIKKRKNDSLSSDRESD